MAAWLNTAIAPRGARALLQSRAWHATAPERGTAARRGLTPVKNGFPICGNNWVDCQGETSGVSNTVQPEESVARRYNKMLND
jgi:hypothetical protein